MPVGERPGLVHGDRPDAGEGSMTPPDFTITPLAADRPIPARKATGAAISSGHGVATTSTRANCTGSPDRYQASPAIASETRVKGTAYRSERPN